ncbi:hypothetical protein HAX54_034431, partial [Datura stramonium]|nr:hypothetical protein [Datura stramonium]
MLAEIKVWLQGYRPLPGTRVSPVRHGSRLVKRHCGTRRMKFYLVFFQEMVSRGSPSASHNSHASTT